MNTLDLSQESKERIMEASKAFKYNLQIFSTLHQAGSMLARESWRTDSACDRKGHRSISAMLKKTRCPGGHQLTLFDSHDYVRKPSLQVILAASMTLAAGLLAWYYM
jgi:hypothetical protein